MHGRTMSFQKYRTGMCFVLERKLGRELTKEETASLMRGEFPREELEHLDSVSCFSAPNMVEVLFTAFVDRHPAPEPTTVPLPIVGLGILVLMIVVAAARLRWL